MLSRRVILLSLFVLFVGIVAQNPNLRGPNGQGEIDDDAGEDGQPIVDRNGRPSNNNGDANLNRPPARRVDTGNQQPVANVPQPPPVPAPRQQQSASIARQLVTPIASSLECKTDVQKYCNKGSNKVLPNLKVLQCIDDLDNVSGL